MSPTSLRIEVEQVAARLMTLDGGCETVTFFEHPGGTPTRRTGTIVHRLNDPGTLFIPCRVAEKDRLMHLDWIAYVEFEELPPEVLELAEIGARSSPVTLHLVTGHAVEGELFYEGGARSSRVSDYLNRLNQRFVLVSTPDAVLYVRRRAIARVDV